MGKGGGSPKQRVTEYYMTVHYGICQGPVETLSRIKINDKVAWEGRATTNARFRISNTGLFGGVKKEGGVLGDVYYQSGAFNQSIDSVVADKYGRTPSTMTNYRGVATAMFTDRPGVSSKLGFYWSANQPFVPAAEFTVTRIFRGWRPGEAIIVDDPTTPRALYFSIDDSTSMADKLVSLKAAMSLVFDDIELAINAGLQLDIGVQEWSGTQQQQLTFATASISDITQLRNFVDSIDAAGDGTNFDQAAQGALAFFTNTLSKNLDRRVWVFITDGSPTPAGVDDTARTTASDLLDQSSGSFSIDGGTAVDCFGINVELTDTSSTSKLDNTPFDGVPVVSGSDPSGLQGAVQAALFGGVPAQMNPAHIIYECLTNRVWGMGAPTSVIDEESFSAASQTLYAERFGLSLIWSEQTEIESFVQEVLDHIEANLYVSPSSGKFVLKLIREDYDETALPVLDETNCEVVSYTRRSPGEVINEINVTWTNPDSEKEETLTIQDLGAIVSSGGEIISDSRNYYGVQNKTLAWQLAQRDIATATAPLATVELEVNRTAWDFGPGDVFKLTAEEHGADEEVIRIVRIDYGTPGDSTIKINGTQDIFAFERPEYEEPPTTAFEDPSQDAEPITDILAFTLNYYLGLAWVANQTGQSYPSAYVAFLASTDNEDAQDFDLIGEGEDAAGNTLTLNLGTKTFTTKGQISEAFAREATTTTVGWTNLSGAGNPPTVGGFVLLGNVGLDEEDFEMALISGFDGSNYTLVRGVLDTIPKAWPMGTEIRFFDQNSLIVDQNERGAGDVLDYDLIMNTSINQGELGQSEVTAYPNERAWLPSRPANVSVEGSLWANIDNSSGALTEIECSWSNRNRVTEDFQVLGWTAATVTPESGQTTVIEFYDESDLTGIPYRSTSVPEGDTNYTIPIADFNGVGTTTLKFRSARDGLLSFTGHERKVILSSGYGQGYGIDYGGDF